MCLDSVPSALVARKLEGKMQFAFGWTMATTKKHLAEIGGWEAMVIITPTILSWETASRDGYRVELMRKPVCMVFPQESVGQFFVMNCVVHRIENVRPTAYRGLILTHGLPWALLAAVVAARAGWTESPWRIFSRTSCSASVGVDDRMVGLHDPEQGRGSGLFHCGMPLVLLPGSVVFFRTRSSGAVWFIACRMATSSPCQVQARNKLLHPA